MRQIVKDIPISAFIELKDVEKTNYGFLSAKIGNSIYMLGCESIANGVEASFRNIGGRTYWGSRPTIKELVSRVLEEGGEVFAFTSFAELSDWINDNKGE